MKLIGLTGSIGMGKSTTAGFFAELGIPVFDADKIVHELYDYGGEAVSPIAEAFEGVVVDGKVDREKLSQAIRGRAKAWSKLESIVHPLVAARRQLALDRARREGADLMVLDIPLLFEKGLENTVDTIVVVSASPETQRLRVLERPGMTEEKLDEILAQQAPDSEKREKADYIVITDRGLEDARSQVRKIVDSLRV